MFASSWERGMTRRRIAYHVATTLDHLEKSGTYPISEASFEVKSEHQGRRSSWNLSSNRLSIRDPNRLVVFAPATLLEDWGAL